MTKADPFKGVRGVDWFASASERKTALIRQAYGLPPLLHVDDGKRAVRVDPPSPPIRRQRHVGDKAGVLSGAAVPVSPYRTPEYVSASRPVAWYTIRGKRVPLVRSHKIQKAIDRRERWLQEKGAK